MGRASDAVWTTCWKAVFGKRFGVLSRQLGSRHWLGQCMNAQSLGGRCSLAPVDVIG
jgi:hypothetical protein